MRNARKPARALTMLLALPLGLLLCGCMHDPLPYSPHYSDITLADPADGPVNKADGRRKGHGARGPHRAQTVLVPDACITPDVAEQPVYLPAGCANNLNLQIMVERKKDLGRGRKPGPATAAPAVRAAERYLYGGTDAERRTGRLESPREQTSAPSLPQGTRSETR
jgi:hypothetical protein